MVSFVIILTQSRAEAITLSPSKTMNCPSGKLKCLLYFSSVINSADKVEKQFLVIQLAVLHVPVKAFATYISLKFLFFMYL
jgi:hypothetical protein